MTAPRRPKFKADSSGVVWTQSQQLQETWANAIQDEVSRLEQEARRQSLQSGRFLKGLLAKSDDQGWLTGKQHRLHKVLQYVSSRAGLDASSASADGAAELSAALHSTFSMAALPAFERLAAPARAEQLDHIAQVVLGVCVYNQSQGIFTTVANLPAAVSVPVSLQQLGADIRCWHSALEGQLIGLRRKVSVRAVPGDPPDDQMQRLAAHIALHTLALDSTAQILTALQACLDGLDAYETSRKSQLAALHAAIGPGKAGIRRHQIFPIFEELAAAHQATCAWLQKADCLPRLWACLQSNMGRLLPEVRLASSAAATPPTATRIQPPQYAPTAATLRVARSGQGLEASLAGATSLDGPPPLEASSSDRDRMDSSTSPNDGDQDDDADIGSDVGDGGSNQEPSTAQPSARPVAVPPFHGQLSSEAGISHDSDKPDQLSRSAFSGHCPILLADGAGLLWPADLKLQRLQYDSRTYGFSSQAAFQRFESNPDACLASLQHSVNQLPALLPLLIQLECSSLNDVAAAGNTTQPPAGSSSSTLQRLMALPLQQADFTNLSESRMGTSASAMVSDLLKQTSPTALGLPGLPPPSLGMPPGATSGATGKGSWPDGMPGKLSMHSAPLSHSQSSGDRLIKALRPRTDPQQQSSGTSPLASRASSPHGKPPTHRPSQALAQEQRAPRGPGSPRAMHNPPSTSPMQSPTLPGTSPLTRTTSPPKLLAFGADQTTTQQSHNHSVDPRAPATRNSSPRVANGGGSEDPSRRGSLMLPRDAGWAWMKVEEQRENTPWPFIGGLGGAAMLRQHSARSTQRASTRAQSLLTSHTGSGRSVAGARQTLSASRARARSQDAAVQTDLHPPDAAFDPSYEWNVWSIRRRAVALTNLRHKVSHSAQTEASGFRQHVATQYWQPKASTTQTPTERGQSMPRKFQQIRGIPYSKECAVVKTIEIDIGQPYEM